MEKRRSLTALSNASGSFRTLRAMPVGVLTEWVEAMEALTRTTLTSVDIGSR